MSPDILTYVIGIIVVISIIGGFIYLVYQLPDIEYFNGKKIETRDKGKKAPAVKNNDRGTHSKTTR